MCPQSGQLERDSFYKVTTHLTIAHGKSVSLTVDTLGGGGWQAILALDFLDRVSCEPPCPPAPSVDSLLGYLPLL